MNEVHAKSLELMEDYFSKVTPEEFLKDYLEVETFEGPTIDEFLSMQRPLTTGGAGIGRGLTNPPIFYSPPSMETHTLRVRYQHRWFVTSYRLIDDRYLNRSDRKYLQRQLKLKLIAMNGKLQPRTCSYEDLLDAHEELVHLTFGGL